MTIKAHPPEHRWEDDGGPPAPEPPTCEDDRDRLAAEVERLKVQRDEAIERLEVWSSCIPIVTNAAKRREELEVEVARITAERDALLSLMVQEGDESPPLWYAQIPDSAQFCGLRVEECETKAEAVAAVLRAAGIGGGE